MRTVMSQQNSLSSECSHGVWRRKDEEVDWMVQASSIASQIWKGGEDCYEIFWRTKAGMQQMGATRVWDSHKEAYAYLKEAPKGERPISTRQHLYGFYSQCQGDGEAGATGFQMAPRQHMRSRQGGGRRREPQPREVEWNQIYLDSTPPHIDEGITERETKDIRRGEEEYGSVSVATPYWTVCTLFARAMMERERFGEFVEQMLGNLREALF